MGKGRAAEGIGAVELLARHRHQAGVDIRGVVRGVDARRVGRGLEVDADEAAQAADLGFGEERFVETDEQVFGCENRLQRFDMRAVVRHTAGDGPIKRRKKVTKGKSRFAAVILGHAHQRHVPVDRIAQQLDDLDAREQRLHVGETIAADHGV